jgi:hypothetical protein
MEMISNERGTGELPDAACGIHKRYWRRNGKDTLLCFEQVNPVAAPLAGGSAESG